MKNFEIFADEMTDENIDKLKDDLAGLIAITSDVGYIEIDYEDRVATNRSYEEKGPSRDESAERNTPRGVHKRSFGGDQMVDSPMGFDFGHVGRESLVIQIQNVLVNVPNVLKIKKHWKRKFQVWRMSLKIMERR